MTSPKDDESKAGSSSPSSRHHFKEEDLEAFGKAKEVHLYPSRPNDIISPRSPDGHFGGDPSFRYIYRHKPDGSSDRDTIPLEKRMPARTTGRTVAQVAADLPRYSDWEKSGKPVLNLSPPPKSGSSDTYVVTQASPIMSDDEDYDEDDYDDYDDDDSLIPPIASIQEPTLTPVKAWTDMTSGKRLHWTPPTDIQSTRTTGSNTSNTSCSSPNPTLPISEENGLTFITEHIDQDTGMLMKTRAPRGRRAKVPKSVTSSAIPQYLRLKLTEEQCDASSSKPIARFISRSISNTPEYEEENYEEMDLDDDGDGEGDGGDVSDPSSSSKRSPTSPRSGRSIKKRKSGKFKCPHDWCKQTFTRRGDVSRHVKTAAAHRNGSSPDGSDKRCKFCNADLSRSDARARHERAGACGKRTMPRRGGLGKGKFSIHHPVLAPYTESEQQAMEVDDD